MYCENILSDLANILGLNFMSDKKAELNLEYHQGLLKHKIQVFTYFIKTKFNLSVSPSSEEASTKELSLGPSCPTLVPRRSTL